MKAYQIKLNSQNYSQYHIIAYVNKQLCIVLIDTGACSSHISKDLAYEIYEGENSISYITYEGEEVTNEKLTSVEILFTKDIRINLEIPVDNRKIPEKKKVLLGIDFLENFDYKITSSHLVLDNIVIPRINMFYKDIEQFIHDN